MSLLSDFVELWNKQFGFLAKYKVDKLYLTLLSLARSKNHLRKLHSLLPNQFKLPSGDWRKLERFWVNNVYSGKPPTGGTKPNDSICLSLLLLVAPEKENLKRYYLEVIDRNRQVIDIEKYGSGWKEILSHDERSGPGSDFTTIMFNTRFEIDCYLSPGKESVYIRFVIWEVQLTEDLAHQIIQLPEYCIGSESGGACRAFSSTEGHEVDFWYKIAAERLIDHLRDSRDGHSLVADLEFTYVLEQELTTQIGLGPLPLPIIPVLPQGQSFQGLKAGQLFYHQDRLYVKLAKRVKINGVQFSAVDLHTGALWEPKLADIMVVPASGLHVDKMMTKYINFNEVPAGGIFFYEGRLYLKLEFPLEIEFQFYPAINLYNGKPEFIDGYSQVAQHTGQRI